MDSNILEIKASSLNLGSLKSKIETQNELYKMPLKHKLFKLEGRMGRLNYALLFIIISIFFGVGVVPFYFMVIPSNLNIVFLILLTLKDIFAIFLLYLIFCIMVKRLHDINHSAWSLLSFLIPMIGIIFSLCLLFWPGKKEANQYGKATDMLFTKR